MRFVVWLAISASSASLGACAPQAARPPLSPPPEAPRTEWKQVEPAKQKVPLLAEPAGLPAADPSCQAYIAHTTETCRPVSSTRDALAQALNSATALERDASLTCLENDGSLPPGLLRALR